MLSCLPVVVCLLVATRPFATPQQGDARQAIVIPSSNALPGDAVIGEIEFVGLHHISPEAARSRLSVHSGDRFDAARISADLRALDSLGWFEDVFVKAEESQGDSQHVARRFRLAFHVQEYPFLAGVEYSGSQVLSPQQIKKLLEEKSLSPRLGAPASPVLLHRIAVAIRSALGEMEHPEAQVLVRQERLSRGRVRIRFQIQDGARLSVVRVTFSGHPEISERILRRQMRQMVPEAWLAGLRGKKSYTEEKGEEDRRNLLSFFENHGFPEAHVGTPQVAKIPAASGRTLPWLRRRQVLGLSIRFPVEAGSFYGFGTTQVSAAMRQALGASRKRDPLFPSVAPGQPFSERAVESLRRAWELRLRQTVEDPKHRGNYRVRATPAFEAETHTVSLRLDVDPVPAYVVRRIDFCGNQRFPDHYLRRRIDLAEGRPLDEYSLEAGLRRIARTGYFQPLKKEDIHIETREAGRTADVIIHVHEKGKQRVAFSGGLEQFGSTLGLAYAVFNLLGIDEFLSTQIDGGPEILQLAVSFTKEGFFGSRGTLMVSAFDTFLRPRFSSQPRAPFLRTETAGVNLGWSYALSDVNAVGIDYGLSRSLTESVIQPRAGNAAFQATHLRSETSSRSLGIGWVHSSGEQKIQATEAMSGSWLGGDENLLKSKAEYGRIFPDGILDRRNAWAFRMTASAAGSYKGAMPPYARFFAGDDLVRGLRPGELGPYEALSAASSSSGTKYSAVPAGANLLAASNLEYRFPLIHGVQGATFFDAGSGLLLPNWLGHARPPLIESTNAFLHGSTGFEMRWTVPTIGVPLRVNYSLNFLRLNRAFFMPDGSIFRIHNRFAALGWGLGPLF